MQQSAAALLPLPLSRSIITIDCKVSLEKLGQSNLVHCPQKLEPPPLHPSTLRPGCRVPEQTTAQIRPATRPAGTDFTRTKPLSETVAVDDARGCGLRPMAARVLGDDLAQAAPLKSSFTETKHISGRNNLVITAISDPSELTGGN